MTYINQATSQGQAAPTPAPIEGGDDSHGNVQYLIASVLAESFALTKKEMPTEKEQELQYIEAALTEAADGADFTAQENYWKQLASTLPKGSALAGFAQAQYNMFANDPTLKSLEDQLSKDGSDAGKGLNVIINGLAGLFGAGAGPGEAALIADRSQIAQQKQIIMGRSKQQTEALHQSLSQALAKTKDAMNLGNSQMKQMSQIGNSINSLNQIKN